MSETAVQHAADTAPAHPSGTPQCWFRPVHPLNYNLSELLGEQEEPSSRWSGVTRYVMAHVDHGGRLAVLVGFRPGTDPGHIDNVRCFRALLGRAADAPDPLAAIGPLEQAAAECEEQWGAELDKLFGHGLPGPTIAPVTRDPAAARLHE